MVFACVQDVSRKGWLVYREPRAIVHSEQIETVASDLARIEEMVESQGLTAVGFISYEAAPAFDPSLTTRKHSTAPHLWFALFEKGDFHRDIQDVLSASSDSSQDSWKTAVTEGEYREALQTIRYHLKRGDSYQVNYTFPLTAELSQSPEALFLDLMSAQAPEYGVFIKTDSFALCSASPELFFSLEANVLTAKPMKGTAARHPSGIQDIAVSEELRHSTKDRSENVMIVDMIRNDISKIADSGSVRATSLFDIERYPSVWQMTSTVTATTPARVFEVFEAMFPCASITGAPKASAMQIIAKLEDGPRGVYTGAIGRISPGRSALFNVGIRTAWVDLPSSTASYGTGSGVVWDSSDTMEYSECLTKAKVLAPRPDEFSLLETMLWNAESDYWLLEEHLARLARTAEYFQYPCNREELLRALSSTRESLDATHSYRVRIQLSRSGEFKIQPVLINLPTQSSPVILRLASQPVDMSSPFLYHKTTNRMFYEEMQDGVGGGEEALLWNSRGEITETPIANLVVVKDNKYLTPPESSGLLPGTLREHLLRSQEIVESTISLTDLRNADRIFLINSVRGWREARMAEDHQWIVSSSSSSNS